METKKDKEMIVFNFAIIVANFSLVEMRIEEMHVSLVVWDSVLGMVAQVYSP